VGWLTEGPEKQKAKTKSNKKKMFLFLLFPQGTALFACLLRFADRY